MEKGTRSALLANRYRLIRKLGEGGMGEVYLARDTRSEETEASQNVAVKFLTHETQSSHVQAFKREFALLTRLSHPNLAKVFDLGFDAKRRQYFFTTEFVDGKDLYQATREAPLDKVYLWLAQVCDVLGYIHAQGIVHNDLKPSNILIANDRVKVLDFGMSAVFSGGHSGSTKALGGTLGYLAPEVIRFGRVGIASDMFALGMVLFRILVGHLPLPPGSVSALPEKGVTVEVPPVTQFRKDLPDGLVRLVSRLTSPHVGQRPQNAQEVAQVLSRLAGKKFSSFMATKWESERHLIPWIGRYEELKNLEGRIEVFSRSYQWEGEGICLTGEAGSGKSRFLRELQNRLQVKGIAVCAGRFQERGKGVFAPWDEIFLQLQSAQGEQKIEGEAFLEQFFLSPQAPGSARKESWVSPKVDEQMRMFHAFGSYLRELAGRIPLVFLMDDLHRGDADALDLLGFLLRFCRGKVIWVCTMISPPPRTWDRIEQDVHFQEISLRGWNQVEMEEALRFYLKQEPFDVHLVKFLLKNTKGNCGTVEKWLREATARRWVRKQQGTWTLSPEHPESVRFLKNPFLRQLEGVPKHRKVFWYASSVLPGEISVSDLALLLAESPQKIMTALVTELESGHFVRTGDQTFDWKDARFKRWIYGEMKRDPRLRQKMKDWHLALARHRVGDDEREIPAVEMEEALFHFQAMEDETELARWALRLGQHYLAGWSLRKAEERFRMAQQRERVLSGAQRKILVEGLIHALVVQRRYEMALPLLQDRLELGNLSVEERVLTARELSVVYRHMGKLDRALEICRRSLSWLSPESPGEWRALILLQMVILSKLTGQKETVRQVLAEAKRLINVDKNAALWIEMKNIEGGIKTDLERDFSGAVTDYQEGLRVAMATGARILETIFLHNLGNAHGALGHMELERHFYETALQTARSIGDVRRILFNLNSFGTLLFRQLEIGEARKNFEEGLLLAQAVRDEGMERRLTFNLARLHYLTGDFETCWRLYEAAQLLAQRSQEKLGRSFDQLAGGVFLNGMGRLAEAKALIEGVLRVSQDDQDPWMQVFAQYYLGDNLGLSGRTADARHWLEMARQGAQRLKDANQIAISECGLVENELRAHQPVKPQDRDTIHHHLLQFVQSGNALDIIRGSLLLLDVDVALGRSPEETLIAAQDLRKKFEKGWGDLFAERIHYEMTLATLYRRLEKPTEAFAALERAKRGLDQVVVKLSAENQRIFLSSHLARRLSEMMQALLLEPGEMANLQARKLQWAEKRTGLRGVVETLKHSFSFLSLLNFMGKSILDLTTEEEAAFFLQEGKEMVCKASVNRQGQSAWRIPESLLHVLKERSMEILRSGGGCEVEGYWCRSLRGEGGEAYGYVVVGRRQRIWLREEMLETYLRFVGIWLEQVLQVEELARRIVMSTSELTLLRQTLWAQERSFQHHYQYHQMIGGRAPKMARLFYLMDRMSQSDVPVLIIGENGTGKELVAETLHARGPRADKPFMTIHCGSLSVQILESQLFGHVKGAFTGAVADQEGMLSQVDGGTIFLDEITDLPPTIQVKLLRVIQQGEFQKLGSQKIERANFRLMVSTRRDLEKMVNEGNFRKDFYYRLKGVTLLVPALRERREDIPLLVEHFLDQAAVASGRPRVELSSRALRALCHHLWPGNVRQLANTLEGVTHLSHKRRLELEDLIQFLQLPKLQDPVLSLAEAKDQFTRTYLEQLLQFCDGNVTQAAKIAGLPRPSLHRLLRTHGL